MSKLWARTGSGQTASQSSAILSTDTFTAGLDREFDNLLAVYDVQGSIAHVKMLVATGILDETDGTVLVPALERLLVLAQTGQLSVQPDVEDIHSQVELMLTQELGEAGKKIHAARSRNDQVLVDLKLFLRAEIQQTAASAEELAITLLNLSEKFKDVLLPGYTHFQVAMPSSFGLWFGAYAESLSEDLWALEAAYKLVNKNPLGSAAGYGSSFPIDRELTTKLLGFNDLHWNVVNAQMSRGKTEKAVATGLAAIAATLGRFSSDLVLYLCQNFSFLSLPAEYSTGSSIMPHKKNPDIFELIRAKCNRIIALPNEIALISANLPSGYHRDFQLLKEHLFPALQELRNCLAMANTILPGISVRENILQEDTYKYIFSVEEVNRRVNEGTAFRDAYREVADEIQSGSFRPAGMVPHTHQGSIGNLSNHKIKEGLEKAASVFRQ
ncbi:MAG: argininosuccinate lyase [Bacteroidota bacterium]